MWTILHTKLHTTLRQRQLLPKGDSLLVAVSGGQDSLCLLKLLFDLQSKWHWHLAIAHCDHGWCSDEGIAAHVETIASDYKIPFYLKTTSQLRETEAAARKWRYQALAQIATENGFSSLLTAHTKSDRAETFLYNLIRGAGSGGMSALTWKRNLTPDIVLVRPLLEFTRDETYQFCQEFALPIWRDAANEKLKYARNRIRQELIPYLKTNFNQQVESKLAQTAEILRAEWEFVEEIAHYWLKQSLTEDQKGINRNILQDIPLALQRRVMKLFLTNILPQSPNFEQIESLVYLINAPNKSSTSSLPGKIRVQVQAEIIRINC